MSRFLLLFGVVLCLAAVASAQTKESIVPAGTLLPCTLDEPRFSSESAQVGDPVVCHINSLGMFGRPVFPRGAYLSGRLVDFRDPGHFFGKGWLKLEFESLTLPGGTFPVSAKLVSVPHYKVNAEGSIRGRGHPRRDAIEWTIPILWPEKLITLPMRGPRPTLKGETRILLRLMEDVSIPTAAAVTSTAAASPPVPLALRPRVNPSESSSLSVSSSPRIRYGSPSVPAMEAQPSLTTFSRVMDRASFEDSNRPPESRRRAPRPTVLILKNGNAHLATNHWLEADHVVYIDNDGTPQVIPIDDVDLPMSAQINGERGVPFVLRSKTTEP